jgi:putative ABC transport system permease protein
MRERVSAGLMLGLLWSQFRHRRGRSAALGLAILVAAASFTLLTASASTSELHVRGTLKKNFRAAYDILVRPRGSYTPLEREQGLVRANYLSEIYGGITLRQYEQIKRIPGVEVAAPIANIGTVLVHSYVAVPLQQFENGARDQLFRVRFSWLAQNGLSRYPGSDEYAYVTQRRFVASSFGNTGVGAVDPVTRRVVPVCDGWHTAVVLAPFVPSNSTYLNSCSSTSLSPGVRAIKGGVLKPLPIGAKLFGARNASVVFDFAFPVNVAAIDPVEEAKLVGLDRALVSGRYLDAAMRARIFQTPVLKVLQIPVLEATSSFVDEKMQATVERLVVPPGIDVPGTLAGGACPAPYDSCARGEQMQGPPGHRNATAYRFVTSLKGLPIGTRTFSAAAAYKNALHGTGLGLLGRPNVAVSAYWTAKPARYRQVARNELAPLPAQNDQATWFESLTSSSGFLDQPTDNLDAQFRKLSESLGSTDTRSLGGQLPIPQLHPVGRFDPTKLPGFSPLSRVPLETYYPPTLTAADTRSSRLLHGEPLRPSQNIGDYVQQPPLLLTNLGALGILLSSARFAHVATRQQHAPISVVRVRVAGVVGPDKLSQIRIKTVAQLIHDHTGLAVDITAGSSPTPINIDLPKGKFGRPSLELSEGWVKKGVAVAYLRALDRKDIALFALILVVCAFFLGNGAFASVRTRRGEIGALSTVGWSPAEIFRVVLGELALIGLLAGLLGTGLAAGLVRGFSLDLPLQRTLYVLPIAVGLALVSGLLPAWRAARARPLDAVRPPVTGDAGSRRVRGIVGMAWVNLRRLPGRTAVGAAGLALGVAALTVLVGIERGFQGTLVGTVLGSAVSVQVRGADFVALGLTLGLSALSAADVLYLNLHERQAELVTLQTLGWSNQETRLLVALEALLLALGASVAGAAIGVLVGNLVLGVGTGALLIAAALAGLAATIAAFASSLLPLLRLRGLRAPEVLAAE